MNNLSDVCSDLVRRLGDQCSLAAKSGQFDICRIENGKPTWVFAVVDEFVNKMSA